VDRGGLSARRRVLGTLQKVRDQAVVRASKALADAVEGVRQAGRVRSAAVEANRSHAAEVASRLATEQRALEGGELRVGDLVDGLAWRRRVAEEHGALAARVTKAREVEERAEDGERKARANLLNRKVDADVVTRTIDRRDAEQQKVAEGLAEQAASEAWRPRR
jgi:hypothetical protein